MRIGRLGIAAVLIGGGVAVAIAPTARAEDTLVGGTVDLDVGQTIEIPVGYTRGVMCDDYAVVTPTIWTRDAATNIVGFTGVKPGSTLCRAGPPRPPFRLYQVRVREPAH